MLVPAWKPVPKVMALVLLETALVAVLTAAVAARADQVAARASAVTAARRDIFIAIWSFGAGTKRRAPPTPWGLQTPANS